MEKTLKHPKQLKVEISEDLHHKLKVLLAQQGLSMKDWVGAHVRKDTAEMKDESDALHS